MNIVIFDGVCNFCNASVNWIIRHDKENRLKFAAHQSDAGQKLLLQHNIAPDELETVVFINEGVVYKRSDAFIEICKLLKGYPKFFTIIKFIPRFIRDFFYNLTAKYRYNIFGKKDQCMIPSAEMREKFIIEGLEV